MSGPDGFFPMVYDELQRLAADRLDGEGPGHSLDATALVHEAYLRLGEASFADRSGFFRAAGSDPGGPPLADVFCPPATGRPR